jgi:DNA repair exonuclease SbcCD ATPase subunit
MPDDEEEIDDTDYSEALDLHREANRLEFEIDQLESEVEDLNERIAEIEDKLEQREELENQREELQEELTDLRTRVDRIEEDAVEEFNDHIASLLEILEYENIERIWIERRETEVREGRRKVTQSTFDLHIVRSADGSAYRDSIDNLSESEREVTGLVFALAGYLVHDVHEEVPVMLLDSLEAIDSERIATLVDYFQDHVEYLVVALLPEDAQALDGDHHTRIESV